MGKNINSWFRRCWARIAVILRLSYARIMNFWQFLSKLISGKASMLSPLIRLALVPPIFLYVVNQIPESAAAAKYYLFLASSAAFILIILAAVFTYVALMFGWAGTGRSDRNTMRSEAHVEKVMGINLEREKLKQPNANS